MACKGQGFDSGPYESRAGLRATRPGAPLIQNDQSQQRPDDPGRAAVALRGGLLVRAVAGSGPARQRLAFETKSRVRIAVRLVPSAHPRGLVPRRALVRLRSLGCSVTLAEPAARRSPLGRGAYSGSRAQRRTTG